MKKILIILFCTPFISLAQQKIEGIGRFKINKTLAYSIFDSLRTEGYNEYDVTDGQQGFAYEGKEKVILNLVANPVEKYNSPINSHSCKISKTVCIPSINISGIDIADFYLTFYDDTLIEIDIKYSKELGDAIELKYGKVVPAKKTHNIDCIYSLTGNKQTLAEETFTSTWKNGIIECSIILGNYRDSHCKENYYSTISVYDTRKFKQIRLCDDKSESLIDDEKNSAKKKTLKDF